MAAIAASLRAHYAGLRLSYAHLLGCRLPMLYNDAFRPVWGQPKHPAALGRSWREMVPEAWDFIGPRFDRVMTQGQAPRRMKAIDLFGASPFSEAKKRTRRSV
jgi:hypothetical protein